MKERPILMSAPMVRGCLREVDPKSQTRRVVKPQPTELPNGNFSYYARNGLGFSNYPLDAMVEHSDGLCPYGVPGDRLWVKETYSLPPGEKPKLGTERARSGIIYCADVDRPYDDGRRLRPSIHMPRWASRITLEIENVRVERLQEITVADALAEGLNCLTKDQGRTWKYGIAAPDGLPATAAEAKQDAWEWHRWRQSPIDAYEALWETINGAGSWALNPWVWAITFNTLRGRVAPLPAPALRSRGSGGGRSNPASRQAGTQSLPTSQP